MSTKLIFSTYSCCSHHYGVMVMCKERRNEYEEYIIEEECAEKNGGNL